jgi:hypothetical protein
MLLYSCWGWHRSTCAAYDPSLVLRMGSNPTFASPMQRQQFDAWNSQLQSLIQYYLTTVPTSSVSEPIISTSTSSSSSSPSSSSSSLSSSTNTTRPYNPPPRPAPRPTSGMAALPARSSDNTTPTTTPGADGGSGSSVSERASQLRELAGFRGSTDLPRMPALGVSAAVNCSQYPPATSSTSSPAAHDDTSDVDASLLLSPRSISEPVCLCCYSLLVNHSSGSD